MKYFLTFLFLFPWFWSTSQPLQLGWAVFTHGNYYYTGANSGDDFAFMVYDLSQTENAPGTYQNWPVSRYYPQNLDSLDWKVSRVGTVWGIAIDSSANIYLGANSSYINNVKGTAGWGGIYKVDGNDWSVSDFIVSDSISTYSGNNIVPNTGNGLGDLTYDGWHDLLFFSNLEDGKIYCSDLNGNIIGTFDPEGADDGTSGSVLINEFVYGLAVYGDSLQNVRLYYSLQTGTNSTYFSMTDLPKIYSVALDPITGNFTGASQFEFNVVSPTGGVVTDLVFQNNGSLFVAEKSLYDWDATSAHDSQLLRYDRSGSVWSAGVWYPIGELSMSDCAGGIDIGYRELDDTLRCEGYIWSTGDALYFQDEYIYGMCAIPIEGNVNNQNQLMYYQSNALLVDSDGATDVITKSEMGDVEIFRKSCEETTVFPPPPPPPPNPGPEPICITLEESYIPNVFSPNTVDQYNPVFKLKKSVCEPFEVKIYNRWGILLFESLDPNFNWNGKFNNEDCSQGVYYYVIKSDQKMYNGPLHLIR